MNKKAQASGLLKVLIPCFVISSFFVGITATFLSGFSLLASSGIALAVLFLVILPLFLTIFFFNTLREMIQM